MVKTPAPEMAMAEKLARARVWWNEFRGAIRHTFNLEQAAPQVRGAIAAKERVVGAPAFVIKGETKETLEDGILSGKPWDQLTLKEQHTIADIWHHNHVVVPATEGAALLDMRRVGHGSLSGSSKSPTKHAGKPASAPRYEFNPEPDDAA